MYLKALSWAALAGGGGRWVVFIFWPLGDLNHVYMYQDL